MKKLLSNYINFLVIYIYGIIQIPVGMACSTGFSPVIKVIIGIIYGNTLTGIEEGFGYFEPQRQTDGSFIITCAGYGVIISGLIVGIINLPCTWITGYFFTRKCNNERVLLTNRNISCGGIKQIF
jgi:hypothetical protein